MALQSAPWRPVSLGDLTPIVEGKQLSQFQVDLSRSTDGIRLQTATRASVAYRDVASATNKLTLIAAMLPANVISTHTVFCLRTDLSRLEQEFLCGLFNSFVLNYFVRVRISTHVTTAVVERLPVPRRDQDRRRFREIAALARYFATAAKP